MDGRWPKKVRRHARRRGGTGHGGDGGYGEGVAEGEGGRRGVGGREAKKRGVGGARSLSDTSRRADALLRCF